MARTYVTIHAGDAKPKADPSAARLPFKTPLLQHRIRGALNAKGFESMGRRFSAGDYKGMTIFALLEQQVESPQGVKKEGSIAGE